MELIPWRPFGEGLSEFHTEMDKLRNRFMSGLPFSRTFTEEWSPFMDILETKDKLIVKAELPSRNCLDVYCCHGAALDVLSQRVVQMNRVCPIQDKHSASQ